MATVALGDETFLSSQTKPLWATHLGAQEEQHNVKTNPIQKLSERGRWG